MNLENTIRTICLKEGKYKRDSNCKYSNLLNCTYYTYGYCTKRLGNPDVEIYLREVKQNYK